MRRQVGVLAAAAVAVLAVGSLSRLLLPQDPSAVVPRTGPVVLERDGPLPVALPGSVPTGAPTERPVVVPTATGDRAGTVLLPAGPAPASGWPAVVLVHGGGNGSASALLSWARVLAERGVVAAVYDKRTEGYSAFHRDYEALAQDAVAVARVVRTAPRVDPRRVSLAGFSEGGWVVTIAAGLDPSLFAVAQLSGPGVVPSRQIAWQVDSRLARADAPIAARAALQRALSLRFPGDVLAYGRFDPAPSLAAADVPLLVVFGLDDATVPVEDGASSVLAARRGLDSPTTVAFVPGLGHGLASPGGPDPGVVGLLASWVSSPPSGDAVSVVGAPAQQQTAAPELVEPSPAVMPLLGASVGLTLVGLVFNLIGRRSSRNRRHRVWDTAAWTGPLAVAGTQLGFGVLVAAALLGGGPIVTTAVWAAVKAVALGPVLAITS